ncbi:MAG: hypothetical protein A4E74_02071 [Syntrophus sp. PtaB.Bin075]|nr:MAG: hypothetical protein A4E74_02071 [Syntrophus sp. PtaB.Bin075]
MALFKVIPLVSANKSYENVNKQKKIGKSVSSAEVMVVEDALHLKKINFHHAHVISIIYDCKSFISHFWSS